MSTVCTPERSPVRSASSAVAPVMPSMSRGPPRMSESWVSKDSWPAGGHCDISAGKATIIEQ